MGVHGADITMRGRGEDMARKKSKPGKKKRGAIRRVPSSAASAIRSALAAIIRGKSILQRDKMKFKKAWGELHNCESRLSRLV